MVAYRCDICHKRFHSKLSYDSHLTANPECNKKIDKIDNTTYPKGINEDYFNVLLANKSDCIVLKM